MKIGILNEFLQNEQQYIQACKDLDVDYEVINFISNDWIENIEKSACDIYLVRPSYKKDVWKRMYDERLYFLNKVMKKRIYPSYEEILLYENKKNMNYWLKLHKIVHPNTWIFYDKDEAKEFLHAYEDYPIVFKTSFGSSALGVRYIRNKREAFRLLNQVFTKWKFFNRGYTNWYKTKYKLSYPLMDDKQYNFILFQEKLNVKHEWRMINVGGSYFGHHKLIQDGFHSGGGKMGWADPPEALLNLTKHICDIGNFSSMNVDIFEDDEGNYYVNELQSLFGSNHPSQMYVDGKPGRYIHKCANAKWVFEEGIFNTNGCYDLRVRDAIKQWKECS
ncbi:RimK family alpha-L-glutamate ligase [Pseudogracilibacillus auburnensis]|uniref:Glutathione synthase/RimK-type ligase-like ATP-grasp enzyme n=1 Tax=Pseudogracilibacillus auburnensis TaxID=1494959 RepID=A0A2V3VH21_9BACI|nr:hypothetical protein [Pseudogracilibacillus auburnensis]MBO1005299.1 hypothetical protein [Pseudogracilibacillus auburnensis]PXW80494.1 glutathione synthase/RimK-type ligase-like ATP-grasp enzyme [Pseudogracilibacillus auburnensis]